MAAPDAQELELISQFRERLTDLEGTMREEQKTDYFLIRWIRARDGNLDAAETMLRQSLKWRAEFDIDKIIEWVPPPEFSELCPVEFLGFDIHNSPVTYFPAGKWNFKKVVQIGEKEAFIHYFDQMYERSLYEMKGKFTPDGHPVTQAVYISNADQLSMRTLASMGVVDMILQCVKSFEANQPETVNSIYIVNAGYVFATLFALMKPLLSERTFGKIHIFSSSNSPKCQELLHSHIPMDVLPPRLGGSKKDFRDIYTLQPTDPKDMENEPDCLSVSVPAGEKLTIVMGVGEAGSTISWKFRTEKYDIAFSVNFEDKILVENSRVNSHEDESEGKVTCDKPGDYVFTFDNTYSRLRTKSLEYKIDVQDPAGATQVSFA